MRSNVQRFAIAILAASASLTGAAQALEGARLVAALQQGGYVIVMRHASAPQAPPTPATADPKNTGGERQLDERGRSTSASMGRALRDLKIPVGEVLSSPTFRARETVERMGFSTPRTFAELGDSGQSMQSTGEEQASWLRTRVRQLPVRTNALIVTHYPNIAAAFPDVGAVADGEALIFGPDGRGETSLVARVKITDWPEFETRATHP